MTQTPTTTIPPCWERPATPGVHAWGTVGSCCLDWWVRRSQQDPRTTRQCSIQEPHHPHPWLLNRVRPPLPYTLWRCGGIS